LGEPGVSEQRMSRLNEKEASQIPALAVSMVQH